MREICVTRSPGAPPRLTLGDLVHYRPQLVQHVLHHLVPVRMIGQRLFAAISAKTALTCW